LIKRKKKVETRTRRTISALTAGVAFVAAVCGSSLAAAANITFAVTGTFDLSAVGGGSGTLVNSLQTFGSTLNSGSGASGFEAGRTSYGPVSITVEFDGASHTASGSPYINIYDDYAASVDGFEVLHSGAWSQEPAGGATLSDYLFGAFDVDLDMFAGLALPGSASFLNFADLLFFELGFLDPGTGELVFISADPDSISLNQVLEPSPVPEPALPLLLAAAGVAAIARRRFRT